MTDGFPKIKICGINDVRIAVRAEHLGADYLGFIFAERSPRRVSPAQAKDIITALAGKARPTGVFTDTPVEEITGIAKTCGLRVIQLHSTIYGPGDIRKLHEAGLEVWKLYSEEMSEAVLPKSDPSLPDAILLDGATKTECGGTGLRADWEAARRLSVSGVRTILAGGISAANAVEAARTGCAALDVNSSLETSKAVKSSALLEAFFAAIS